MYCIIYRFIVKDGCEQRFQKAWAEVTRAYIEFANGMGSRLHKSNGNEYIAYARWPSKEIREKAELPNKIKNGPSKEMLDCCETIETLYRLEEIKDLLITEKS